MRYLINRVALAFVSIVGVAVVVFVITQLLPGDAARTQAGPYATQPQIDALRHQMGLDQSLPAQFGSYFTGLFHLDFGVSSRTSQPVGHDLWERLPASIELSVAALVVALAIGLVVGVVSARYAGRLPDHLGRFFTIISSSTASFWISLLAVLWFCNELGWFPSPVGRLPRGYDAPEKITGSYLVDALLHGDLNLMGVALRSLALPSLVLGFVVAPSIIKSVRSSTIRALDSDYARTARLFGYSNTSILFRDGLRNSLLPVLTNVGIVTGYLLGGNVIIEKIFSWPGIGGYAYEALTYHDLNALRAFALLVGVVYIVLNMVLDILYTVVDPRVQLQAVTA